MKPNSKIINICAIDEPRYSFMALTESGEVWGVSIIQDGELDWQPLFKPNPDSYLQST